MSLKPGTKCVIVAGCPENIDVIVELIGRVRSSDSEDAYCIKTVSGRAFHQLREGNDLLRGDSDRAITDRYKLRPLVFTKESVSEAKAALSPPTKEMTSEHR
jgi:hypothetical protein